MGCMTEVVCLTCKKRYDCGYGSYGRYQDRLERFHAAEHSGHEYFDHCGDGSYIDGNNLHQMGVYGSDGPLIAKDYKLMPVIDISGEREAEQGKL